jgi:hypothetical protein|tara:strand:+ start:137 stop:361 length:225 start_codon:yes stop_codon:yes gene_type:complete
MRKPKQFKARGYDGVYSPQRKALDIYEVNDSGQPLNLITSFNKGVRSAVQAEALFNVTVDALIFSKLGKKDGDE